MLKLSLVAGLAVAALIPSMASAQSCEQQHDNRVAGTIAGGVIGAIIGGSVAGRHDTAAGAVIGGVGGAVVGNQLTRPSYDCSHAYGYYDTDGRWHATDTDRTSASGYYDRSGQWVSGAPNGYYDTDGRWVTDSQTAAGYYDTQGYWIPARTSGYGYYDPAGRWVAGSVSDSRYGAYAAPNARDLGSDSAYQARYRWAGAPADIQSREAWLGQRIRRGMDSGTISHRDGRNALQSLNSISNDAANRERYNGRLTNRDQAIIQAKLDDLSRHVRGLDYNN